MKKKVVTTPSQLRFGAERTQMILGSLSLMASEIYGEKAYKEEPTDCVLNTVAGLFGSVETLMDGDSGRIYKFLEPFREAESKSWDVLSMGGAEKMDDLDFSEIKTAIDNVIVNSAAKRLDEEGGLPN
jgi:hypothetical protein